MLVHELGDLLAATLHVTSLPTALIVLRGTGTIIDADRVLVLHAGVAGEFDHPHLLLQNPEGLFASLVSVSGVGPMGPGMGCRAASFALAGGKLVGCTLGVRLYSKLSCLPPSLFVVAGDGCTHCCDLEGSCASCV